MQCKPLSGQERRCGLCSAGVHSCEAVAAVNRTTFLGSEGDSGNAAAAIAGSFEHFALTAAGFTKIAARFATLGLILEALLCIEFLFACSESKFLSAVLTNECFVLIHLVSLAKFICDLGRTCTDTFALERTTLLILSYSVMSVGGLFT
jgi:hypothetical protein